MRKIILLVVFFLFTITITNANSVDFYGEKNSSWGLGDTEVSALKGKIELLQKNTGINSDIVILGKGDKKGCYLSNNFDNCVKNKYGYSSDLIIVLKMKSDISSRGDIRSYMDNKNYPILTTSTLKTIQDQIIYNFKNNDFKKGLIEYYNKLEYFINNSCIKLLDENKKLGGKSYNSSCNITELVKVNNENELLRKQAGKNASFMRNIYIGVSLIIFTIFMVVMHIFYLGRLKKVFNDIKFQLIDIDDNSTFKKDLENIKRRLEKLIKKLEVYLANADKNWIKLRKYYIEADKEARKIKNDYEKMIENFNSQKELMKKIEDFKNINI